MVRAGGQPLRAESGGRRIAVSRRMRITRPLVGGELPEMDPAAHDVFGRVELTSEASVVVLTHTEASL